MNPLGPLLAALAPGLPAAPPPQPALQEEPDLSELSLGELMGIEVTVASRRRERLRDAPAAVYVITGDEIRRAGHTTVQEALRMVPGFHVAQWRTSGWDVTARGFTGSYSDLIESFTNQMLLMVDGVSFFSPASAGIWWPLLDIPVADIDRIEVIRGPAGTLWGANAVNGVVHVITKHPRETSGSLLTATAGDWERSGDYRYGGRMGENAWYRAWLSYSKVDAFPSSEGRKFPEDWWIGSAGYRGDWDRGAAGRYRLVATAYTSAFGEELWDADAMDWHPWDDTPKNGGSLLGSWEAGEEGDTHRVQGWYVADHQKQFDFEHDVQSMDVEYTRAQGVGERHALTWGVGYRLVLSNLEGDNGYKDFEPEYRSTHHWRIFAQDELDIPSWRSKLVFGLQIEDNSLIDDPEPQPNVRWLWQPTEDETFWAATSRAVRTPTLEEVDIVQRIDSGGAPFFRGNGDVRSEQVLSHELGFRSRVSEAVHVDLATFYSDYDDLVSIEDSDQGNYRTFGNKVDAIAYGAELAVDVDVTRDWRLRSAYGYFRMDFEADADSREAATVDEKDGLVPKHHVNMRSYYDLGDEWELDAAVYWTDESSSFFFDNPDYWRVDVRLGWNPSEDLQVSFGVQNLTEAEHPEAGEDIDWFGSLVERNFSVSMRLSF